MVSNDEKRAEEIWLDDDDIADRESMKDEAVKRMKIHALNKCCIDIFKLNNEILCSERGYIRALNEKEKNMIADFENESKCLVYHLIHSFANIGETYEFCRVSNYMDDWKYENLRLDNNILLVYSENITHPDWSESSSILIDNYGGVLTRIG